MTCESYMGLATRTNDSGMVEFVSEDPLNELGWDETNAADFAFKMDEIDPIRQLRSEFHFPQTNGSDVVYFVGNSLGLQPRSVPVRVQAELDNWANRGVNGHFEGPTSWLNFDTDLLVNEQANIVGALPEETSVMNSLTVNLHLLLVRFLGPQIAAGRTKILIESQSFPSDYYAVCSQLRMRGLDPDESIVTLEPREGEHCIRTEDVARRIAELGPTIALVVMSGVHYYTGQLLDMKRITEWAHAVGAYAVFDLAHVAGNVDLALHDWGVDAACWCTYKYMNSGPGGIGGFYIHQRHFNQDIADRLSGWWSHDVKTRFNMDREYQAEFGASEFRLSNVPIMTGAALLGSLDVFKKTSIQVLRAKSILLTGFLERELKRVLDTSPGMFEIITPELSRGAQLSLLFKSDVVAKEINHELESNGVMVDYRKPGLIRAAPAPLYCSFKDVVRFTKTLRHAIEAVVSSNTL
jgi:kynureninase